MVHPKPSVTFELPVTKSHNVQTRIYHPPSSQPHSPSAAASRKRIAIFTHPYAPLGGSFDDPVVLEIVSLLLSTGEWTVVTGNFRGAPTHKGSAPGRTSWSGKPERTEVEAWVRFAIYYADMIGGKAREGEGAIDVVVGGYSYGSLVVSSLDTLDKVLERGRDTNSGKEDIMREEAKRIANEFLACSNSNDRARLSVDQASRHVEVDGESSPVVSSPDGGRKSFTAERGLKMGGHPHGSGQVTRASQEMKRPKIIHRLSPSLGSNKSASDASDRENESNRKPLPALPKVRTAVLLVSLVLPPVSTGLALSLNPGPILSRSPDRNTFVIYGGQDQFTSGKRVGKWVADRAAYGVRGYEVSHAGHFWREDGVLEELGAQVTGWLNAI